VDLPHELGVARARPAKLEQAPDLVLAQRPQRDVPGLPGELRQHIGDLGTPMRGGILARREHEDVRVPQSAAREAQRQDRRRIRGVEVLEDDRERPALADVPEEGRDGVEQCEAGLLGLERLGRLDLGKRLPDLGDDLRDPLSSASQLGAEHVRLLVPDQAPEDLDPRPERRSSTALPGPAPANQGAAASRPLRERVRQPRLPDPGLTRHEADSRPPLHSGLQRGVELRELAFAAEQPVRRSPVHGASPRHNLKI